MQNSITMLRTWSSSSSAFSCHVFLFFYLMSSAESRLVLRLEPEIQVIPNPEPDVQALSNVQLSDLKLSDQQLSDQQLSDPFSEDGKIKDENLSEPMLEDQQLSDQQLSDELLGESKQRVKDETKEVEKIIDHQLSDEQSKDELTNVHKANFLKRANEVSQKPIANRSPVQRLEEFRRIEQETGIPRRKIEESLLSNQISRLHKRKENFLSQKSQEHLRPPSPLLLPNLRKSSQPRRKTFRPHQTSLERSSLKRARETMSSEHSPLLSKEQSLKHSPNLSVKYSPNLSLKHSQNNSLKHSLKEISPLNATQSTLYSSKTSSEDFSTPTINQSTKRSINQSTNTTTQSSPDHPAQLSRQLPPPTPSTIFDAAVLDPRVAVEWHRLHRFLRLNSLVRDADDDDFPSVKDVKDPFSDWRRDWLWSCRLRKDFEEECHRTFLSSLLASFPAEFRRLCRSCLPARRLRPDTVCPAPILDHFDVRRFVVPKDSSGFCVVSSLNCATHGAFQGWTLGSQAGADYFRRLPASLFRQEEPASSSSSLRSKREHDWSGELHEFYDD